MDAIVLTWREILVAIVLASLIYLLEVAIFSRRRRGQGGASTGAPTEAVLERLRAEVEALRHKVEALERRAEEAHREAIAEDTPYGRAVRLAREGITAQELASRCGISRGEAELIIALNRGDGGAP